MPTPQAPQDAEIQELKKITEELRAVNANTGSTWGAFLRGMLQGGGAIVGGIITVILIGVVLSMLGVIPGFQAIAAYINSVIANIQHY